MPFIELIGIFARPFSLAIRLFANMTAGHQIILVLLTGDLIGVTYLLNQGIFMKTPGARAVGGRHRDGRI